MSFALERVSPDPGRAGMYRYGPRSGSKRDMATIWISGPVGGWWWATVRFRSYEKDFEERSLAAALASAMTWVDTMPELEPFRR